VPVYQPPAEREADSGPIHVITVEIFEHLENRLAVFGRKALTVVFDRKEKSFRVLSNSYRNTRRLIRPRDDSPGSFATLVSTCQSRFV
jgi:hypothetical protein